MQKIPADLIDDIRQKANIVDIIGDYVQLKKAGKNYLGLCPFHEEKTPSFNVTEEKQIFKCFGCGKGGNVFSFLQEIEGITFVEAVKKVADRVNVPLNIEVTDQSPRSQNQQRLIALHRTAFELYQHVLTKTKLGVAPLDYLTTRGLDEQIIERFGIGFAPGNGQFLLEVLQKEGFTADELSASGLFSQSEQGTVYDRFQSRIMFPLRNPEGQVIGFSGRIFSDDPVFAKTQAKYLNSPETSLFSKRTLLYNFDLAKSEIRRDAKVFLFEGFMDVIAAYQGGIVNGVASMGTSLTEQQINMLQRVAKELVICYDGDAPGQNAIAKSLGNLKKNSKLVLQVVVLPEQLDPDEYLRKYGAESFKNFLNHEQQSPFQFNENYLKKDVDLNNEQEKVNFLQLLLKEVAENPSPMERDVLLHSLSDRYKVSLDILQNQLHSLTAANTSVQLAKVNDLSSAVAPLREKVTQLEKAQRSLLYRIFYEADVRQKVRDSADFIFPNQNYQELAMLIDGYAVSGGMMDDNAFIDYLGGNTRLISAITSIFMMELDPVVQDNEVDDLIKVIKKAELERQIEQKKYTRDEAHRLGDKQLETELTVEIMNLMIQLKR